MQIEFEDYTIESIQEKHAWRLCDFVVSNEDRLKTYFPKTLEKNLNPTLAKHFASLKEKEFLNKEEFLFTVKENTNRTIVGLVYVKKLNMATRQGELAYCIGYQHKGKGLMTKIIDKIVSWSFNEIGLSTLQIIVHKSNTASKKVAENNKFVWQSTLPKEHKMPNGEFVDMELYEKYCSEHNALP